MCRATLYTPKVEDTATRMSETWNMRQAQRAVSIDNISFIANAASDERHSTLSKDNVAFSTLNNTHHSHHTTNNFYPYNQKQNNIGNSNSNNNTININNINNNNHNINNSNNGSSSTIIDGNCTNTTSITTNIPVNASIDNIHKASDDEPDNIIPWRAQLRKTNSRLSLIG